MSTLSIDLDQEQDDIFDLLRADAFFQFVHGYQVRKNEGVSMVEAALGGIRVPTGRKGGLVFGVELPEFEVKNADSDRPVLNVLHKVALIEIPEIRKAGGGCQITSGQALLEVLQRLHARSLGTSHLALRAPTAYRDDAGGIGFIAQFERVGELIIEQRGALPLVDIAGTTVTITGAALAGEALYFTTDGAHPIPGAANTTLYSAPFTAASGTVIRAVATATGRALGGVTQAIVP